MIFAETTWWGLLILRLHVNLIHTSGPTTSLHLARFLQAPKHPLWRFQSEIRGYILASEAWSLTGSRQIQTKIFQSSRLRLRCRPKTLPRTVGSMAELWPFWTPRPWTYLWPYLWPYRCLYQCPYLWPYQHSQPPSTACYQLTSPERSKHPSFRWQVKESPRSRFRG